MMKFYNTIWCKGQSIQATEAEVTDVLEDAGRILCVPAYWDI